MKFFLKPVLLFLAIVLIVEEWLWDALKAQLHRLSGLREIQRMELAFRMLPPWASLLALGLPILVMLPFKIAGLWGLANGHPVVGLLIFLCAKIVGTALAAYIFDLVRDSARELAWFNAIYLRIMGMLAFTRTWLDAQPIIQSVRRTAARWAQQLLSLVLGSQLLGAPRRRSWFRRLHAAKAAVRKSRSSTSW